MVFVLAGLTTLAGMVVIMLMIGLITGDIKLPKPRHKRSKKPVGPVTLNDLADSYERQAALLIKGAEENARGGHGALARSSNEEATRLLKQAKAARKQYLDELMEP